MTTSLSASSDSTSPPRATAWRAVLLLAVTLFAGALMRTVFSPLQEAAKLDIGLSDFGVSLVQGLATGAPIALVSLPLAWIIDHGHRVRLLIALLLVCVIGTIWTGFAATLPTLFVARMLCAVGSTCAVSVIISLVADLCEPEKRGRAIVILALGTYAGAAAAFVLGGMLLTTLGAHPIAGLGALAPWRATHLLLGIAGSVLLAPLILLREPSRHEVEIGNGELRAIIRAIWAKARFSASAICRTNWRHHGRHGRSHLDHTRAYS